MWKRGSGFHQGRLVSLRGCLAPQPILNSTATVRNIFQRLCKYWFSFKEGHFKPLLPVLEVRWLRFSRWHQSFTESFAIGSPQELGMRSQRWAISAIFGASQSKGREGGMNNCSHTEQAKWIFTHRAIQHHGGSCWPYPGGSWKELLGLGKLWLSHYKSKCDMCCTSPFLLSSSQN